MKISSFRVQLVTCVAILGIRAWGEELPPWPALEGSPSITKENASRLRLIAERGSPWIRDMAWSTDGRYLGLLSSTGLSIYRVEADKSARLTRGKTITGPRPFLDFSFSHTEEAVATCDGSSEIQVWDIRSGWRREGIKDAGVGILSVALSPLESLLAAVAKDGRLFLWRRGILDRPPQSLRDFEDGAAGISSDREGKLAVTWRGAVIHVWDLQAGRRILERTLAPGFLDAAALAPGGTTLWAAAHDGTPRWSVPGGEPLPQFPVRILSLTPGSFHPGGKMILGPDKNGLAVFSLDDGKPLRVLGEVPVHARAAFEPTKGKVIAAIARQRLTIHDASSGTLLASEDLGRPSRVIACSPAGDWLLCGDGSGEQELLDVRDGIKSRKIKMAAGERPMEAALDPKGKLLAWLALSRDGKRGEATVWKAEGAQWKPSTLLDRESGDMRSLAFSHDGRWLALGTRLGEPLVKVYAVETGRLAASVKLPAGTRNSDFVLDVAFIPRTGLVAALMSRHPAIVFIDVEKAALAFEIGFPGGFAATGSQIRIDPRGTFLLVPGGDGLLVLDVERRQLETRLELDAQIERVDVDPAGALVACTTRTSTGNRGRADICVLEMASGTRLCQFPAHPDGTSALHFLRRGNALLSSSHDGSIRVWGVGSEERETPKAKGEGPRAKAAKR